MSDNGTVLYFEEMEIAKRTNYMLSHRIFIGMDSMWEFFMYRVRKQMGLEDNWCYGREVIKPVTVAVLDSGINEKHPDLEGKVQDFFDYINGKSKPYDDYGHGTHVCGIIGGSGKAGAGRYKGICENVRFLVFKVLNQKGEGDSRNVLKALEKVKQLMKYTKIDILNISLGGEINRGITEQRETMELLDELWNAGVCVVCAAGNLGPRENSISYMGLGSKRICVGCHEGAFRTNHSVGCSAYSGRGSYIYSGKPDIVSPGTEIISCNSFYKPESPSTAYCAKSGTSMSTAIVSGMLCRMISLRGDLSNRQMKDILLETAVDIGEKKWIQGNGMIDYKNLLTHLV